MATLQTNPSDIPNDPVEWTRELNISELGRVGYMNIHFTLWNESSTAVPNVIEGSVLEINNSMYLEASTVAINIASQTVDAINWVIYIVSGSTATATLTGTAPTIADYDVDKGGFYDGSGNRYTGHYMYVSPAGTAYSNKGLLDYAMGAMLKYRIDDEADDFVIDANLDVKGTLNVDSTSTLKGSVELDSTLGIDGVVTMRSTASVASTLTLSGSLIPKTSTSEGNWNGTVIIPRGVYAIAHTGSSSEIEVYVSGGWEKFNDGNFSKGGMLFSDGTNFRHNGGVTYYRKF